MTEVQLSGKFQEDDTIWSIDTWVQNGKFNIATTSEDEESGFAGAELDAEQVSNLIAAGLDYLARFKNGDYKDSVKV